jgi:hypothetical protein
MKLPCSSGHRRGSTLAVVMVLCAVTLLVLTSALSWVSTNTTLSQRNNEYFRTTAVAEAATEKVISHITADYKRGGDSLVIANAGTYAGLLPTTGDNAAFGSYNFSDGQGGSDRIYVYNIAPTEFRLLTSQYRGLRGYTTPFRVIANATQKDTLFKITSAVRQDIEVTTIPLFQFAIFYNIDMEINPGPDMEITGRVHGNENIYLQPQEDLTFHEDVTAAGTIIDGKKPGDPLVRPSGTITFNGERDSGASSLNLPIGTDNSPEAVHEVVEPPPVGESPTSVLGSQRLYNKADMIITIPPTATTPSDITITSGIINSKGTTVPQQQWDNSMNSLGFLKLSSFYNPREARTVTSIDIDVGRLRVWSGKATNILRPNLPANDVRVIYVDDQRPKTLLTEPGVRMHNGTILPSKGLTVATVAPIYVKGDYNTSDTAGHVSTGNNTTYAKPAALIGDAITIMSSAWTDSSTLPSLSSRVANNTTVNAAFLAGIVETTPGSYSGGVENFPRFLENWSGKTFTYNGSMVVMYPSRYATGAWSGTGDDFGIYNPPTRQWAFDTNFRDVAKMPPGTPVVRKIVRNVWKMIKPNSVSVVSP